MAEKEVIKPSKPTRPIETTTSSRIKINAVYEDAKDIHIRNYILYTTDDGYLSFDKTGTELIDCDTLMDLCLKGAIVNESGTDDYFKVMTVGKGEASGDKYTSALVIWPNGVRKTYYSKEYVDSGLVDPGGGKNIGDVN